MSTDNAGRLRRGPHPLRAGHRPGDPRRARHRLEDVLRLLDHVRRRAEHPDLPGVPGPARLAAGGQRGRDRVDDPDRAGAGLPDRHVVPLRPEELLLPGHPQGLPDQPVRRAAVHRRPPGRRGRRRDLPGRDRAGAPRGGHRQEPARRWRHRPHPRRRPLAGRLQPGRHPAGRDRHPADARHRAPRPPRWPAPTSPSCARSCRRSASPTCGWSRAACAATSTSRSPRSAASSGAPAPRPRTSTRCARSSGRCASRCAGRPPCSTAAAAIVQETRHFHEDTGSTSSGPEQGGGDRLPVLPRARPGADRAGRGVGREARRGAARAARRPARPAAGGVGPVRHRDGLAGQRRRRRPGRARPSPPAPRRPTPASGGSGELARRANDAGVELADLAVTPAQVAELVGAGRRRHDQRPAGPAGARRRPRRRGRPGRRWSRPAGSRSWGSPTSWSPPSTRRSPATPTSPTRCAAARCRRSARWSARS